MGKIPQAVLFLAIPFLWACSPEPEAINYGKESCSFCKMTIMDSKFGCELVSTKGKIFKFDDLSCLVKYMKISEQNKTEFAHMVVNKFDKPGEFIEISKAFFINSPNIKSPMLGNTASFIDQKTIDDLMQNDKEAKKITWNELLTTLQ